MKRQARTPPERHVCLFCGGRGGLARRDLALAEEVGAALGRAGIGLVFGGGGDGLMGAAADGCLDAGGYLTGVFPRQLQGLEVLHPRIHHLLLTDDMATRQRRMRALSEACVFLAGGLGTFQEVTETLNYLALGLEDTPLLCLDPYGHWRPLFTLLEGMAARGYTDAAALSHLRRVKDVAALLAFLETPPSRPAERSCAG